MERCAIIPMLIRMGVNNCTTINYMNMIKESNASEKFKEKEQEEPLLNM